MMPKLRTLTLLILLTAVILLVWPVQAQEENGLTLRARAGLDGLYQQNHWVPVTVTVTNNGPAIEGILSITTGATPGSGAIRYQAPLSLPTQSNKVITLYIYIHNFTDSLTVSLLDENGTPLLETNTNSMQIVAENHLFYAVLSNEIGNLDYLENVTGSAADAAVAYLTPDALPALPAAWRALDVLVLSNVDTSLLSTEQQAALRGWVETGGELVIVGGLDWQSTTAVFSDMLPVTISGVGSREDLPALRTAAAAPFRDEGPYIVTESSLTQGELLLHEDGLPLLARRSWGQGSVYFLALDPSLAPLLDWNGRQIVWSPVTSTISNLPKWAQGAQNGYSARSAVSRLPTLTLPSVLQLVFFLVIYTVVMGPLNYIVLRRRQRMELAWITIPVLVLVFTAVTYFTGFQIRGNEVIVNEMTVAYGEAGADTVRAQNLIGLYSPRRTNYNVSVPPSGVLRPFSGEITNTNADDIDAIVWDNTLSLQNVQVDIGEVATFVGEGTIPAPDLNGSAELRVDGQVLAVDINVQNNSDQTFEAASLLVAGTAVGLGDIAPGDRIERTFRLGAAPTAGGSAPIFAPGGFVASPLTHDPAVILGSGNYYDDPVLYARWELLQAIDNVPFPAASTSSQGTNTATLIAWAEDSHLPIELDDDETTQRSTTLYFLELPFSRQLTTEGEVSIPLGFLDWFVTEQVNVYDPSVQNFYMQGGSVAFEYVPWPEFQEIAVSELAIILQSGDASYATPPQVALWQWDESAWETIASAGWGNTAVADYGRFLGPDNSVRIQLRLGQSQNGVYINEIYPLLTGTLSE